MKLEHNWMRQGKSKKLLFEEWQGKLLNVNNEDEQEDHPRDKSSAK